MSRLVDSLQPNHFKEREQMMQGQYYASTFTVDEVLAEVFDAIKNVRA